jgi:hypothetical protein
MFMSRLFQRILLAALFAGSAGSASAFSLLGPFAVNAANEVWQVTRIGYDIDNNDIGGPLNLGEEYRWNIKTITYGFDESFLNYFGQDGVDAINAAVAILNNLPPVSKMTTNLSEFPLNTRHVNYRASALNLIDLKSIALATLVEEMGLAGPEHYTWTLRSITFPPDQTNYVVIKRNFDPVTLAPSSYVNGTLYTYAVIDPAAFDQDDNPIADAVEIPVDPLASQFTAVAAVNSSFIAGGALLPGDFLTGLTRDDAGGLRYLYHKSNYNIESLIPGTVGTSGGPYDPATTNNAAVDIALRAGVDKINFKYVKYDSQLGNFNPFVQSYKDTYVTNSHKFKQNTERLLVGPDIVFSAADLGATSTDIQPLYVRSPGWVNNDALNGQTIIGGPGIISPQVAITFSKVGFNNLNIDAGLFSFLDEYNPFFTGFLWGSFDGTTNAPIVYPTGTSIEALEQAVLHGN